VTDLTGRQAYLNLQRLARDQGRNTQELFELYIHERFLARVASSTHADRLILKGGMLLAVVGERRATRDADLLARGIGNDDESIRSVIREIASLTLADGVEFDVDEIATQVMREEADYHSVRVTLPVDLGGAKLRLKLDLSFGDPVEPERIDYPTLLEGTRFPLLGYPLQSVIAEKGETMVFLGDANTRDRDYGDVYLLSGLHPFEADPLRDALTRVAEHRGHELQSLGPLLQSLRITRQETWLRFRERAGLPALPESFTDVVDAVVAFLDPVIGGLEGKWDPARRMWES
jgi:hypothetical protein